MDKSTRVYYIQLCNVLKIEALLEQNKKKWRVVFLMLFSPPSHIKIRKALAVQKLTFETSPNVQLKYYSIYSTGIVPKWVKEGGWESTHSLLSNVPPWSERVGANQSTSSTPILSFGPCCVQSCQKGRSASTFAETEDPSPVTVKQPHTIILPLPNLKNG